MLIPQQNELNVVEIEGQDSEGQKVKAVLATLKPSTLPSVSRVSIHWAMSFHTSFGYTWVDLLEMLLLMILIKHVFVSQVCLGGFEITPPVVFRLRSGSGPVHISGQHLVSEYFIILEDVCDLITVWKTALELFRKFLIGAYLSVMGGDQSCDEEEEKQAKPASVTQKPSVSGMNCGPFIDV